MHNEELKILDSPESSSVQFIYKDLMENKHHFDSLLNPKVIIDVGAHVGVVSIYLAQRYPDAVIFAIEPYLPNFDNLKKNIEANNISSIIPINIGLSGDGEDLRINAPSNNTGAACHVFGWNSVYYTVKTKTLSQFLSDYQLIEVDFIKMDIESAEYSVLTPFNEWEKIKDMYIELHGLFPHPKVCWNGLITKWRNKLLSVPVRGKMNVITPDYDPED